MIHQWVDGLKVTLKTPHDLGFLQGIGQVFCVFDQLISGNLGFGVQADKQKYFVKYAGADTQYYNGQPQAAVLHLRQAGGIYQALAHPSLTRLLGDFETEQGYGLVFAWYPGFALSPMVQNKQRLMALPLVDRLRMYDGLCDLVALASRLDYVVGGLSDQHILVDFDSRRAAFCSVDNYRLMPTLTPHPKLAGSPAYLPPEAYQPGAPLDEVSNVYMLGMLAFTFFDQAQGSAAGGWDAGQALRRLALQASSKTRAGRPGSVEAYLAAWRSQVMGLQGL